MGVLRKKRDQDGKRERHKTDVPCPAQTKDYCNTFLLINLTTGMGRKHRMIWGESRLHNWSLKLVFRLYNMVLNNAYKMYTALVKEHTPEWRFLTMGNAVRELTHDLCQRGISMRKLRAEHPSWTQDMGKLFGWVTGRKVWSDAKGMMMVMPACLLVSAPLDNYALLKNKQQTLPCHIHQSKVVAKRGDADGKIARVSWQARRRIRIAAAHTCTVRSAACVWVKMCTYATALTGECR